MDISKYHVPLSLNVLSYMFLALGAIFAIIISIDIVMRKGWWSMMGIMIPVYIINATYLGPVTLFLYFRYGRPSKPADSTSTSAPDEPKSISSTASEEGVGREHQTDVQQSHCHSKPAVKPCCHSHEKSSNPEYPPEVHKPLQEPLRPSCHSRGILSQLEEGCQSSNGGQMHCHSSSARPMWATVLAGVSHCGAGCVLGDLVGEWLVFGTGASINGQSIWAELLIDYAFALLFGIGFQYFSIAPMSGEWGPKTIWRAAKADVASLTSFEIGAFGWMVIYQVGIFNYRLDMTTWLYWWMMQIGMAFGAATAFPANWWLIKHNVKEPCC